MIRNWYNQIPYPALKTKRERTKYINWQQFTKGMRGKPNEQLFPRQVVIQLPKLFSYLNLMKLGSKYNLLNTPTNYRTKKDPMKALGRIDFTKYALSTIIYLMQSSENG